MLLSSAVKVFFSKLSALIMIGTVGKFKPIVLCPKKACISIQMRERQIPPRVDVQSWPTSMLPSAEFVCFKHLPRKAVACQLFCRLFQHYWTGDFCCAQKRNFVLSEDCDFVSHHLD